MFPLLDPWDYLLFLLNVRLNGGFCQIEVIQGTAFEAEFPQVERTVYFVTRQRGVGRFCKITLHVFAEHEMCSSGH